MFFLVDVCMVFEMLGDNLLTLIKRYNYKGIPLPFLKKITRQMLEGMEFLHDKCKIIHTDLKPENVLLSAPLRKLPKLKPLKLKGQAQNYDKLPLEEQLQNPQLSRDEKKKLRKKLKKKQQKQKKKDENGNSVEKLVDQLGLQVNNLSITKDIVKGMWINGPSFVRFLILFVC